ncbi:unnamed protein product [Schistosoma margrebowiei]|uniref:Uncharacterized protein n=1 Tax=Schistosoma margrebowiei TaxID=48269 RepID=A0A183MG04_9TREM|nr:unnamed protein product [Schistosoma margrebowiei]
MESSRPKKKRKNKEQITPGNGDRHEKNEQELDGTRKEGPGQSGLENAGRWPMPHWEEGNRHFFSTIFQIFLTVDSNGPGPGWPVTPREGA